MDNSKLTWKSYYGYRNAIDMGKRHASIPALYMCYRYLYHVYRMMYFKVKMIQDRNEKEYYKNCVLLHKQVLVDAVFGRLGCSKNYYPGKKI